MGGPNSGRKPDMIKMVERQREDIKATAPSIGFEIPNYSGLQDVKKTDAPVLTTETDPVFTALSGSFLKDTGDSATGSYTFSSTAGDTLYLLDSASPFISFGNNVGGSTTAVQLYYDSLDSQGLGGNYFLLDIEAESAGFMVLDNSSGDSIFTVRTDTGNVGIGTTTPSHKLHIAGTGATDSYFGLVRLSPSAAGGESEIGFFDDVDGTDTNDAWVVGQGGWGNTGKFVIGNENNGAGGDVRLAITKEGNVGIGTTTPRQKLDVNGNICLSGGDIIYMTADGNISGGCIVRASRYFDNRVSVCGTSDGANGLDMPIGVAYYSGSEFLYLSGSSVPVIYSGITKVWTGTTATRGDFASTYDVCSGSVKCSQSPTVPADASHWREVGHILESAVSGSFVYAMIHFN